MRSQNAATAFGGRIASECDRSRCTFALVVLCGMAALTACSGSPAPTFTTSPSSDVGSTAAAVVAPAGLPAPHQPAPLPADLTGLGAAEVLALLGSPDFRRSEPPAELWQYRAAGCILDVFLYRDSGGYRVVHSETRQRRPIVATGNGCSAGAAGFVSHSRQNRL
jgi:hypothetical protein